MELEHYFCHTSVGTILFDPGKGSRHFDPWYALLQCDDSIVDYHAWLLLRYGIDLHKGSRWGAHVTFVRGEQPLNAEAWNVANGETVTFRYSHVIHWANGYHAWVEVWCPRLTELRGQLGLPRKENLNYHLTLGRLVQPRENTKRNTGLAAVL